MHTQGKGMHIDVGDGHSIYYEIHGSPTGRAAVVLHGGPGGEINRKSLKHFDLRKWRILLFDQRGTGKSTPTLELRHNTTWDLVADMELLRRTVMKGDKWTIYGGSWGSTLALAYASKHGDAVSAMIIRGIYLAEKWEDKWLYAEGGASHFFPETWARFSGSARQRQTVKSTMASYRRRFRSSQRRAAIRDWNRWESTLLQLQPQKLSQAELDNSSTAILEHHYFQHHCWIKPGQLLRAARRMHFPVYIIQGRYDMICPPAAAIALDAALPNSHLTLTVAGHSGKEKATAVAIRRAIASAAS